MSGRVRVHGFTVSLDGFAAGPGQSLEQPLGVNGPELMEWLGRTRSWRATHGLPGGETGVDDTIAAQGFDNVGAWIMGRNMFGPVRGPWPDDTWRGWWGESPPYRVPVFVLTHHARAPLVMAGGTVFHFVTGGIDAALEAAHAAAGGRDVRVGGGTSTVRQFLAARLLDDVHLAVRPIVLGAGESLFTGLDLRALGYHTVTVVAGERATHVTLRRDA